NALLTADAQIFDYIPRLAPDRHSIIAHIALDLYYFRVGPEGDVFVRPDGGHFWGQNAGGAIQCGEGLIEFGHVPADARLAFNEKSLLSGVTQRESGMDARDPTADYKHIGMDGNLCGFEGVVKTDPLDSRARQRFGFGGRGHRIGVHPGIVFPDINHLEVKWVQSAPFRSDAESVLVQQRRTGSHHDTVEAVLADVLLDKLLTRIGAHVFVIAGDDYPWKFGNGLRHRRAIHHRTDIVPTVADVETDANLIAFS